MRNAYCDLTAQQKLPELNLDSFDKKSAENRLMQFL
jgi:hypothetical protein